MFLALDLGNSSLKAALFGDSVPSASLPTPLRAERLGYGEPDALAAALWHLAGGPVVRVGLASVVPAQTEAVDLAVRRAFGVRPHAVAAQLHGALRMGYATPETLGADRWAAAVAAHHAAGRTPDGVPRPVLVVDAGTAVTFEVVDAAGVYRGGAIAAGPALQRHALARGTAQLPTVDLDVPASPIGRNTHEAMQAGLLFGFLDSVSGMLLRLRTALHAEAPGAPPAAVVGTGGWAAWLAQHGVDFDAVLPHLVLQGVWLLTAEAG